MHEADETMEIFANPGTRGWAAGGAFAGRVTLGWTAAILTGLVTAESEEAGGAVVLAKWFGNILGAAGGAALGAPEEVRGRAAAGAAIGSAIPFLGFVLAPIGAYVASAQPAGRSRNVGKGAKVAVTLLGVGAGAALGFYGYRWWRQRKQEAAGTVLVYDVRELPGLQVDMHVGDELDIDTGAERWTMASDLAAVEGENGWAISADAGEEGTWQITMYGPNWTQETAPENEASFTVKIA